jgi:hypothetical protein
MGAGTETRAGLYIPVLSCSLQQGLIFGNFASVRTEKILVKLLTPLGPWGAYAHWRPYRKRTRTFPAKVTPFSSTRKREGPLYVHLLWLWILPVWQYWGELFNISATLCEGFFKDLVQSSQGFPKIIAMTSHHSSPWSRQNYKRHIKVPLQAVLVIWRSLIFLENTYEARCGDSRL